MKGCGSELLEENGIFPPVRGFARLQEESETGMIGRVSHRYECKGVCMELVAKTLSPFSGPPGAVAVEALAEWSARIIWYTGGGSCPPGLPGASTGWTLCGSE